LSVVGFYTDSKGRRRPITRSLFHPPKNKIVAKNIMIDTPSSARESISYLNKRWENARTREEKVKLIRYANSAANRAKVISENERISSSQRAEAREVHHIYRSWVERHKLTQ
jgi:hypothetical protein